MKNFTLIILSVTCFILFSCGSAPANESEEFQSPPPSIIEEKNESAAITPQEDDEVELINEDVKIENEYDEQEDEYLRSTNDLKANEIVTKKEFIDDKAHILKIISELNEVMAKEDTEAWLKYISPDSIRYYSNPANIRKAQKKLPDKTIQLKGIGDYFKHIFIPSRRRSNVDEIRYISKNLIKAVEVKPDGSTVVYYQFVKINGKWLVHIPTL